MIREINKILKIEEYELYGIKILRLRERKTWDLDCQKTAGLFVALTRLELWSYLVPAAYRPNRKK